MSLASSQQLRDVRKDLQQINQHRVVFYELFADNSRIIHFTISTDVKHLMTSSFVHRIVNSMRNSQCFINFLSIA